MGGRQADVRDDVWTLAQDLGLDGAAIGLPSLDSMGGTPSEAALLQTFWGDVHHRLVDAGDPSRLRSACNWLRRFKLAHPTYCFLRPRGGHDDMMAAAYNERSFALLSSFIRLHGSVQPGKRGELVSADAIAGYGSALRHAAEVLSCVKPSDSTVDVLRRPVQKHMLLEQPVLRNETREIRRGLRFAMLRTLAAIGSFDRRSSHGRTRWRVFLTGIQALLRGGEFGVTDRSRKFVITRGLHWGRQCIEFLSAEQTGDRFPSLNLWVVPIKDSTGRAKRRLIPISALHEQGETNDPLCAYSSIVRAYREHAAHLTEEQRARVPMFLHSDGVTPWCTADVDQAVSAAVVALGLDPTEFGGVSLRIAGASDLRDVNGVAGKDIIQARGRWSSDIHFIYQRTTATEMLVASRNMTQASGLEAEVAYGVAQSSRRGGLA